MMLKRIVYVMTSFAVLIAIGSTARAADPEVQRVLNKFRHEPTVRDVQKAAISYYNVSPGKVSSLRTRARTKALLPGLSVSVTNSLSNYSLAVDDIIFRNSGTAIFEDQNADYFAVRATASWSLDRLIFNAEELDVLSLVGIQDAIQREVTTLYYVRRRLQIQLMLSPPKSLEARLSSHLRLEELTGLINAYTGGYFSKAIKR